MQIWEQFLSELEREWGAETVNRWLRPLKIVKFDAGNLYLEATDSFQVAWYDEHVRPRLYKRPLINNNGRAIRIHFSTAPSPKKSPPSLFSQIKKIESDFLDPDMTLEQFLFSQENAMALQSISEVGRSFFNPIYLFGPTGSGKTHLLTAAAKLLQNKGKKIFFVRAETFTEHVVQAIRLGHMQELRKAYRSCDALFIDDIHLFSKKSATQEEFFHTFNDLHTRGSPILLTARHPPSKLQDIEPRLVSRFEWGITIPMERGDLKAILEKKGAVLGLNLHSNAISYLVEKFPSSPINALTALSLRCKSGDTIDPNIIEKKLSDLLAKEAEMSWTPEKIIKIVAAHYGITGADLMGKSQTKETVLPRQLAMYLCRSHLKMPFQKIGDIFGRDHSTVITGIQKIEKGIEEKNSLILDGLTTIQK